MIDKLTAQRIKDTARIEDVVGDYVHLTRRGANLMGLCPFHNERTPSFSVSPKRNFCYCFSCHKGGSPVNFLMEKEGISYHDALLQLAQRYGIEVEEKELSDEEKQKITQRESLLTANEWAMQHFRDQLLNTEEGRNIGLRYFYERGLTDEAVKTFNLGYNSEKGNPLTKAAKAKGHDLELLHTLGLVGKSQDGNYYDRFKGRVIYPIQNSSGKVVAFGGRDLSGNSPAKYINSPESPIYHKSNELYGIYQAKNQMGRTDQAYLVEGYMDVIGLWQSGVTNAVASSGTALTDGQINLMHRFAQKVTLVYDGDAAGIKAALKGIDMLLSHKMEVKSLLLPDGHDPDSFAKIHTPEQTREYFETQSTDIIRFKTDVLMAGAADDPTAKSRAIHSIVRSLACISDNIQQMVYIQQCARQLNVDEKLIAEATRAESLKLMEERRLSKQREDQLRKLEQIGRTSSAQTQTQNQPTPSANILPGDNKSNTLNSSTGLRISNINFESPEIELTRLAVRYGMLPFCETVDDQGNTSQISTVEFIRQELEYDGLDFRTPICAKIFKKITELEPEFNQSLNLLYQSLQEEIDNSRRQAIDEIAAKGLTSAQIEREEKLMEERLASKLDDELRNFTLDYCSRILASDEDDDIRTTVNQLIVRRNVLSKIFSRQGTLKDEIDTLADLVPRKLGELKLAYLQQQRARLQSEVIATPADDTAKLKTLIAEIQSVQAKIKIVSGSTGDRILNNIR